MNLLYETDAKSLSDLIAEAKKVKHHKLYIPSTFDLVGALPVKERKHVDKYAFVTTYLYRAQYLYSKYQKAAYVPINKEMLKRFVTANRASAVINFWLQQGVIEVQGNSYQAGVRSKGYRFTKAYRKVKAVETMVMDEVFEKRLTTLRTKNVMEVDKSQPHLAYLLSNLQDVRIDHTLAYSWLLEQVKSGVPINYGKYHLTIDALIKQEWFFSRDTKGRRVHNNFVNLAKSLKPYVYLQHDILAKLVNIDVANSQPLMLAMLMLHRQGSAMQADARTFLALCEAGTLYNTLVAQFGLQSLTKKEFKTKLFTWFYAKNAQVVNTAEWFRFAELYPSVAAFVVEAKRTSYKALSHAMQQLESELVIDTVIKRIAYEHKASWCLTVHDSITTTTDMQDVVIDALLTAYGERGVTPTLNVKAL
jgi:hypothetical protein